MSSCTRSTLTVACTRPTTATTPPRCSCSCGGGWGSPSSASCGGAPARTAATVRWSRSDRARSGASRSGTGPPYGPGGRWQTTRSHESSASSSGTGRLRRGRAPIPTTGSAPRSPSAMRSTRSSRRSTTGPPAIGGGGAPTRPAGAALRPPDGARPALVPGRSRARGPWGEARQCGPPRPCRGAPRGAGRRRCLSTSLSRRRRGRACAVRRRSGAAARPREPSERRRARRGRSHPAGRGARIRAGDLARAPWRHSRLSASRPRLSHGVAMTADDTSAISRAYPNASELEMIRGTRAVVDLVASKWSVDVLYLLASGTRRYSEVFYEVGEISKKTLPETLRALERDGLIARRVYAEVPPKVEYSLTPLGWSLTGPVMAMYEWGAEHLDDVEASRMAEVGAAPAPAALAAA